MKRPPAALYLWCALGVTSANAKFDEVILRIMS